MYRRLPSRILTSLKSTPHENIYTLPNLLTFSRLVSAPVLGYLIIHDFHLSAVSLFCYAGITDLVDGWIARKWGSQTVVGTVIDPMADKTLMTVVTICLAVKGALPGVLSTPSVRCELSLTDSMPVLLAGLILGRDVALGIAAIYYRYISLPEPKTFTRYWNFSLPSAEVHPTQISKINTVLQLGLMGGTLGALGFSGGVGFWSLGGAIGAMW